MTTLRAHAPPLHSKTASAARRWLLDSGIRCRDKAGKDRGALHRAFDAERGILLPRYPEITAYAAQFHRRWNGDAPSEDINAAIESVEWLLAVQADAASPAPGAFPYAVENGNADGGYFTFDSAIAGHALLDVASITGDERYRAAAERAARWVLQQQAADGSFCAGTGGIQPVSWASDGNCLHGKLALFLGRMWQEAGDTSYRTSALALLRWLATLQRDDGGIETARGSGYVFAHAHCYAVEGLLAGAVLLNEQRYLENAVRGAAFLARAQRGDGGVLRHIGWGSRRYLEECGARLPFMRMLVPLSDVGATAQAIRVWTWVQALDGGGFARNIEHGLAWLAAYQLRSADARLDSGFPAGIDPLKPWRRREMQLYPWVAMFAADASRLQSAVNVAADLY